MANQVSEITGLINYNKKKKRWDGVVCQIVEDDKGKQSVLILDAMSADFEVDLQEKMYKSIATKPWLVN